MATFSPEDRRLFDEPNFASLATIAKDDTPRNTIIWVELVGDEILLNGYSSRAWIANLRRNPNVAIAIFDLQNPYRQVIVTGIVVEITQVGAAEHIDKLARKYTGTDYQLHLAGDPRQIVRVQVKTVRSRSPGVNQYSDVTKSE
jgi:PPOX class probable F420-dependent enzyme